jgi:hypothetical protein
MLKIGRKLGIGTSVVQRVFKQERVGALPKESRVTFERRQSESRRANSATFSCGCGPAARYQRVFFTDTPPWFPGLWCGFSVCPQPGGGGFLR